MQFCRDRRDGEIGLGRHQQMGILGFVNVGPSHADVYWVWSS